MTRPADSIPEAVAEAVRRAARAVPGDSGDLDRVRRRADAVRRRTAAS